MDEIKARIIKLEGAIKRLDSVKKHLSRNAKDIKAEIHANVSRNLECLRGREVSLLGQVDQVLGAKEDSLQVQQVKLNQALGVLQTGLTIVQDDSATERQLVETLDKLNKIELSPEETPYISFRADHFGLRESILNYGRVDANGLPLISAFEDPGNPSACLPRHVEDYEDADHHVFYKTVEEVKRSQSSTPSISVTIPKLSNRVEDWLQKKMPSNGAQVMESSPAKQLPAVRPNTLPKSDGTPSAGSLTSTPGSSCSLNNWLSIIKQHADLEEEHDFEIIDNTCVQKGSPVPVTSSQVSKDFFHHIEKDLKMWLSSSSPKNSAFAGDFFKHVPKDSRIWLLQACQQMMKLDNVKGHDFFQHISKEPSTWLRSRAHSKRSVGVSEVFNQDFFAHISKDLDSWLLKKGDDKPAEPITNSRSNSYPAEENKWLMRCPSSSSSFQLEDVCRANELCSDMSECVSQPSCFSMCCQTKVTVKNPIEPAQVFKPLILPPENWLASTTPQQLQGKREESTDKDKQCDWFGHITTVKDSMWLSKSSSLPALPKVKDNKEETNLWLQKTKSSVEVSEATSLLEKSRLSDSELLISEWLLVPAPGKDECEKEKEDSEGWSICTDSTSVSSEQYASDVAVADAYINKWLL